MMLPEPNPTETNQPTSKYASVLFQSTEVYDIGPFRFPIYKTLTPTEAKALGEYQKAASAKQLASVSFARDHAKKLGVKTKVVLAALRDPESDLFDDLVYDNVEEFNKMQEQGDMTKERNIYITAVMQSRGSVQLIPDGPYEKTRDWTVEDTTGLLTVADEIFKFITWEKDGWPNYQTEDTDKSPEVETVPLEIQQATSSTAD
jgi:hypothetical protein